jgi:hypothetical protein
MFATAKVKVLLGIASDQIVRPCFFHEGTITSAVYLDTLENFMFPQTVAEIESLIFNKMVQQSIFVLLYPLLWMNDFLIYRLAWEGQLIGSP